MLAIGDTGVDSIDNICYTFAIPIRSTQMTTQQTKSGVVVATFTVFNPFDYVDQKGFDVVSNDEATDLLAGDAMMEFHPLVGDGEPSITIKDAIEQAKERGNPGGLVAWTRVYKGYADLPEETRQKLAGKWLYFTGTVLRRRGGGLCVASLICSTGSCDRYFDCLGCAFGADGRVALRGK